MDQRATLLRWLRHVSFAFLIVVLTGLTQIGGVVLLGSWLICRALLPGQPTGLRGVLSMLGVFVGLYAAATYLVVPPLARLGGRVPLTCSEEAAMASATRLFCVLNRHYVTPQTKSVAEALAAAVAQAYPGTLTLTLDASFPFLNGFPLPPHLSHDDGRKLDIAYFYREPDGAYLRGITRSPFGYFAFEQPDGTATLPCDGRSDLVTLRWDLDWLQPLMKPLALDAERTAHTLRWLVESGPALGVSRIFVEPHVAESLGVAGDILRFQGCRAARHDDHIHFEVGP